MFEVFIGYDASERVAYDIAKHTLLQHASIDLSIARITSRDLVLSGMYQRPTVHRNEKQWDLISRAPMSTSHAIARFFIPFVARSKEWALFCDGDVLFRRDVNDLLKLCDDSKAIMCVQHEYEPQTVTKKNDDIQTRYLRKNWSSVMLWNLAHPAHAKLTLDVLNRATGRDLHRFCWLEDSEIGALPHEWNWLVGHSSLKLDAAIVHFTEGLPNTVGHQDDPYADEWRYAARELRHDQWIEMFEYSRALE